MLIKLLLALVAISSLCKHRHCRDAGFLKAPKVLCILGKWALHITLYEWVLDIMLVCQRHIEIVGKLLFHIWLIAHISSSSSTHTALGHPHYSHTSLWRGPNQDIDLSNKHDSVYPLTLQRLRFCYNFGSQVLPWRFISQEISWGLLQVDFWWPSLSPRGVRLVWNASSRHKQESP